MATELYFDCPNCSKTLRVDRSLVSKSVDCPKCNQKLRVPDIRDGLNPRLRSEQRKTQRILSNKSTTSRLEKRKSVVLVDDMNSLSRRMAEQGRQLEYLQHNVSICVKQLNLVRDKSTSSLRTSTLRRPPVQKGPSSSLLLKWSLTLSLWVITAGMVMLVYLFGQ